MGQNIIKVILVATLCIFALIGLKQVWFGIRMVKPLAKLSETEVGEVED